LLADYMMNAAADAAEADLGVLPDQLAATTGEDRWPVGETCAVLLAAVRGKPSDGWLFGSVVQRIATLPLTR
jgi:hypothetical protein